jgi:ribosomal protein S18 acetylase RimI-like enzyme
MARTENTQPVEIRFLTADDADAYWRIRLEALERDPEAFASSAEEHRALSINDVKSRLSSDPANNFIAGAFVGGRLAGTAGFYREPGLKRRHKGHVWGVYLAAGMRGQGIGRRMLQALLERAAAIAGLEQILISVTTTQVPAVSLYRSLGFQFWGREVRALKIGERYVDEDYMVLHLDRSNQEQRLTSIHGADTLVRPTRT